MAVAGRPARRAHRAVDRWTVSVINGLSTVASIVNLVRPTTIQFTTLTAKRYRAELTTRCDYLHALAKFLKFRVTSRQSSSGKYPYCWIYQNFVKTQD